MEEFKCIRCVKEYDNYDSLRRHTGRIHKIHSEKFYVEFWFNREWPLCSCGCGEKLNKVHKRKIKPEFENSFINGHNSRVVNNFHQPGYHEKAIETLKKRYRDGELISWQQGKTKENCEGLDKISKKLKGKEFTEEHKRKLRKPKSEEHKRKLSLVQKELFKNDKEFREKFQRLGNNLQKHKAKFRYNKQENEFYEEFLIPIFGKENIKQQQYINGYSVDFIVSTKNEFDTVIEYYGDYWHGNPDKYKDDFYVPQSKMTIKEIREKDRVRESELGAYKKLVIIWENDVKHSPVKIKNILKSLK